MWLKAYNQGYLHQETASAEQVRQCQREPKGLLLEYRTETIESRCNIAISTLNAKTSRLVHAAEQAFADRSLLLDEKQSLFEQNNENVTRSSLRSTVTGTAEVMSYDDIVAVDQWRKEKDGKSEGEKGKAVQQLGLQDWCHAFPLS